jgi:hypothetical protein
MGLFGCDHKWEKVDKVILKSPFEQFCNMVKSIKNTPPGFFTTKVIWLIQCTRCGKLKILTEENG